jgi:hypothetical protein
VSAVPEEIFMHAPPELRESPQQPAEERADSFWGWLAIGMLVFCWIAEASMCAMRGF